MFNILSYFDLNKRSDRVVETVGLPSLCTSVKSQMGFFILVVLIVEAVLVFVAVNSTSASMFLIGAMVLLLVFTIIMIAVFTLEKSKALIRLSPAPPEMKEPGKPDELPHLQRCLYGNSL